MVAVWAGSTFFLSRAIGWDPNDNLAPTGVSPTVPDLLRFTKNPRYAARKSAAINIPTATNGWIQGFYELNSTSPIMVNSQTSTFYVDDLGRSVAHKDVKDALAPPNGSYFMPRLTKKNYNEIVNGIASRDASFAFERAAIAALATGEASSSAIEILEKLRSGAK